MLPAIRSVDGFQNIVANLGTERDKAFGAGYIDGTLTPQELLIAYRMSAMAKRVVNMPAEDSCREWREWQAEAKQITKLEAEEKRLGLLVKVKSARKRARLFGGAAIFIGTGESNLARPLNPERISEGGIKYLTLLNKHQLSVDQIQRDPNVPGFNMPESYRMSAGEQAMVDIHPSRLAIFKGDECPDEDLVPDTHGWGESVLNTALEKVKQLDGTEANVASLIYEAKVDVIKVKNFTQNLREGGQAFEKLMLKRFGLAATAKGINGALLLDGEEDYDQKSANFSTLPQIVDTFRQAVSAATGIPVTLLFGVSPGGMNATGESDIRGYYDRIKAEQELEIEPAMDVLDECLIRSALGSRPEEIHYNWRKLWQPSQKEIAETAERSMNALEKLFRMEGVSPEAVGKAGVNTLTESGAFPGLEAAANEFPQQFDDPEDPDEMGLGGENEEGLLADAAMRTLYVRRDVLNADEIVKWAKEQGFETTLPADDMHVTIAFSREAVDWMKMGEAWQAEVKIASGGPRLMERFGDARVLLFSSSELSWRHEEMKRHGASWDHDDYQPHITISYAEDAPDLADVEPYRGEIILGPEIFEEINDKWLEGVKEE